MWKKYYFIIPLFLILLCIGMYPLLVSEQVKFAFLGIDIFATSFTISIFIGILLCFIIRLDFMTDAEYQELRDHSQSKVYISEDDLIYSSKIEHIVVRLSDVRIIAEYIILDEYTDGVYRYLVLVKNPNEIILIPEGVIGMHIILKKMSNIFQCQTIETLFKDNLTDTRIVFPQNLGYRTLFETKEGFLYRIIYSGRVPKLTQYVVKFLELSI